VFDHSQNLFGTVVLAEKGTSLSTPQVFLENSWALEHAKSRREECKLDLSIFSLLRSQNLSLVLLLSEDDRF